MPTSNGTSLFFQNQSEGEGPRTDYLSSWVRGGVDLGGPMGAIPGSPFPRYPTHQQDSRTAGQQHSSTAAQQHSSTAAQQDSRTAGQQDSRTAGQQDSRTAGQQDRGAFWTNRAEAHGQLVLSPVRLPEQLRSSR